MHDTMHICIKTFSESSNSILHDVLRLLGLSYPAKMESAPRPIDYSIDVFLMFSISNNTGY